MKKLTKDINNIDKKIILFMSIDEESKRISRLSNDTTNFESTKTIWDKGDTSCAYKNGVNLEKTLKEHNINMYLNL